MSFIKTIPAAEAKDDVHAMYARQQAAWGFVPDYAKIFCYRPEVMARWGKMLAEIKRPVDDRRLEMVTFAAAHELNNSPCSLAHGAELAKIIGKDVVIAIANGEDHDEITAAEYAMMKFARRVARDAVQITSAEVEALGEVYGIPDEEIFDIVAIAASRSFFTKVLDALGSLPDRGFLKLDRDLRRALTVGRPINCNPPEYLDRERAA